ncbi:hypothetical protein MKK63_24410 [Methylobacterium sp. J-088]|uniref:hypothetical protein n=1 Tax=Methylobacterium sp. J-088 TaxID=2836664 RepID=UPI001FB968D3|nr:hypothetical protein [Methylobacterium sp. J-088]MCJ2065823.1 hypothetical protein [Methylobacterium sp. J-088]
MARRAVFRSRLSPKSVFSEQTHERASIFIDRIGKLLYDTGWTESDRSKLNHCEPSYLAGSGQDLASTVRSQVLSGLQRQIFEASVYIMAPALLQARTSPHSLLGQEDIEDVSLEAPEDDEIDPLWSEDDHPRLRQLSIKPEYWALAGADARVDWIGSKISIANEYLRDNSWLPRRDLPLEEIYQIGDRQIAIPLYITFPQTALRKLITYEDIPGQEWLDRYKIYREKGRAEIPAVIWRYISLTGHNKSNPPTAKKLSEIAQDYLKSQGLESPADQERLNARSAALQEMARSVLQQLEDANLSTSVLVTGNPRSRRRV